ncbi:MAG TPA: hypothetical protein VKM55_28215 [Candidatus Lokiarchaeia archaeon]|nr:hypothetical protein [Candidatus Lokiarchaeia archaeon]
MREGLNKKSFEAEIAQIKEYNQESENRGEFRTEDRIDEIKKLFNDIGVDTNNNDIKKSVELFNPRHEELKEINQQELKHKDILKSEVTADQDHSKKRQPLKGRTGHHLDEGIRSVVLSGKEFSAEEYNNIAERRKSGDRIADIARAIGVTYKSLCSKFDQQNIHPVLQKTPELRSIGNIRFSREQIENIIDRRKTGERVKKIALDLGIDKSRLFEFFIREGIKPELEKDSAMIGKMKFSKEELNLMIDRRKNGDSLVAIAKDNGIKKTTLLRFFTSNDIRPEVKKKADPPKEKRKYSFSFGDISNGRIPLEIMGQINDMRKCGEFIEDIAKRFNIQPRALGKYFSMFDISIFDNDVVQIGADRVPNALVKEMIEARKNGDTIVDIARKNNLKSYSLRTFFIKEKIVSLQKVTPVFLAKREFSKKKLDEICERRRNGKSLRELASELQVNQSSLRNYFHNNNVRIAEILQRDINRKYEIDHNFFKEINSSKKAYLLGLIMADGNIHRQHYSLRFDFQKKDIELCEIARNSLSSNAPIHERIDLRNKPQVYIQFNSKSLCEDLQTLGIGRGIKIYHNTFPDESKVPKIFQRDLIRGLIDGDGGVSISHINGKHSIYIAYGVNLTGTHELLSGVQKVLIREANLNETKIIQVKGKLNTYSLQYGGSGNVSKIFRFLYPPGFNPEGRCLRRKYERMKEAWEKYQSHKTH